MRALIGSHDNDDDDYDASGLDSPASIATYFLDMLHIMHIKLRSCDIVDPLVPDFDDALSSFITQNIVLLGHM